MGYSTIELRERAVAAYLNHETINSIAKHYQTHRTTIYRWIKQYENESSLERRKNPGSGRPPKLKDHDIYSITQMILKPASHYGYETDFWTIKRIIAIAKKNLKLIISKTSMYEMLYNEEFSYKKPEKRYYEADKAEQKKWLKETIPEIKACAKKHKGIVYFEDEANISLNAVVGKTWAPIGQKVIQKVTGHRASVSAMSAISTSGDLIFTLHEKKITSIEIIHFLDQMLKHHPRRHLIVIMDRAPVHTSKITKKYITSQKRLHIFYLPARSPEFNADEKVWNYLKNEELKSHQAKNKDELKKLTKNKLSKMSRKPKLLKGLFMRCEVSDLFEDLK